MKQHIISASEFLAVLLPREDTPGGDYFKVTKQANSSSGSLLTTTATVTTPQLYYTVFVPDSTDQPPTCSCGAYKSLLIICRHIAASWSLLNGRRGSLLEKQNVHRRWWIELHPLYSKAMKAIGISVATRSSASSPPVSSESSSLAISNTGTLDTATRTSDILITEDELRSIRRLQGHEHGRYSTMSAAYKDLFEVASKDDYRSKIMVRFALYGIRL